MATREEPGSSCGERRVNPVDQLEKAFMDCFSSLTKETPLTSTDRSQERADEIEEIPKFLQQAKILESFFVRKRVEVGRVRPELILRDETMELKSELVRKENLLRMKQEKMKYYQYVFGKVSNDSSSESEKGLSSSASYDPQHPPNDAAAHDGDRNLNLMTESSSTNSPQLNPTSSEEREGWGTVSPFATNASPTVDQSIGSSEQYCPEAAMAHSSSQYNLQREYWPSTVQWPPQNPHSQHHSAHGFCEGPCCNIQIPPFSQIPVHEHSQGPPHQPSFHMNQMEPYQYYSYPSHPTVSHQQRPRPRHVSSQCMEDVHTSLPPFSVVYPEQGFSMTDPLSMDPYQMSDVTIARGRATRTRRGRGSRGPRGRPRIEESLMRTQMAMRESERGNARPRARGFVRVRRPRGPRGPRVAQGPPPSLNDHLPTLEGYEFERVSIISGGGGGEVAEILQPAQQSPFEIPSLEQNAFPYAHIQADGEGEMRKEENEEAIQKTMTKQALDYSMKRNE